MSNIVYVRVPKDSGKQELISAAAGKDPAQVGEELGFRLLTYVGIDDATKKRITMEAHKEGIEDISYG